MSEKHGPVSGSYIYTPYITINGVRRYHPNGGVYRIPLNKMKKKK